ncbi:helitron_like_N domain-containing protein [Trichonephila clavipes]|nr:helitron_like_N domain-containing protein [Trichonephila clavipes]
MPRKKSNLNNASTREARRKRIKRAHQLAEQIESRNLAQRISTAEGHAQESQEQCNERLQENIIRTRAAGERDIATQLPEQIETRNAAQRIRTAESRARESQEQRDERLQQNITRTRVARERNIATVRALDRQRQRISRSLTRASFVRLAFEYAPDINYSAHSKIAIGGMDKVCQYCHALKFRNEAAGMLRIRKSCAVTSTRPPEPLLSLLTGNSDDSKLFFSVRYANLIFCFQMTSFGATKICDRASDGRNFETTFKIQGQVYHKIGSLMPMPDNNPKFLQIYFMGDCEERVTTRCLYNFIEQAEERAIVILLENFFRRSQSTNSIDQKSFATTAK